MPPHIPAAHIYGGRLGSLSHNPEIEAGRLTPHQLDCGSAMTSIPEMPPEHQLPVGTSSGQLTWFPGPVQEVFSDSTVGNPCAAHRGESQYLSSTGLLNPPPTHTSSRTSVSMSLLQDRAFALLLSPWPARVGCTTYR